PRELIHLLIAAYQKHTDKIHRIKLLSFFADWVKDGFHNFDNYLISDLIKFLDDEVLSTEYSGTQVKMKKYIQNKLLDSKQQKKEILGKPADPIVPKDFDLKAMEKPKIDVRKKQIY